MAIGKSAFRHTSTTTNGKLSVIDWQKDIVKQRYKNMPFDGMGISLPGKACQLERHRDELLSYGIKEENQIMIDWDFSIYTNLRIKAKEIGFKGLILYGNLINAVKDLWNRGVQVDVIDLDHIGYLEQYHLDLLTEACGRDVKVFIGVFATRGNSGGMNRFQSNLITQSGIQGYYHRRGNYTYSLRDIQGWAMKHTANKNGYDCRYTGYLGKSTMVSCVSVKYP